MLATPLQSVKDSIEAVIQPRHVSTQEARALLHAIRAHVETLIAKVEADILKVGG